MKRKIVKQGGSAYTLTLPIDWVRKNKVDEKEELDVIDNGKSLVINSKGKVNGGKIAVDLGGLKRRTIHICVTSLYSKGVDEIEIKSDRDISSLLVDAVANTLGYALVSEENGVYKIKDISGEKYEEIDEIFKRVFQMILMFYESFVKDVLGEQKETLETLKLRDREVNKFCLYLQRAINKMSYSDSVDARALFTYSFQLEKVSDEIERTWRSNINYKVKKTREIGEIVRLIKEGLGSVFDSYYQYSLKKIEKVYEIRDRVRELSLKLGKIDSETAYFLKHLVKIIEESADLTQLTIIRKSLNEI